MLNWNNVIAFATNGNPAPDRRVEKSEEEWKAQLTAEQFYVTRKHGTESNFSVESNNKVLQQTQEYNPGS